MAALRPRPAVARCLPPVAYQSGGSDVDPYKTLGLGRDASTAEIKKAFRDKALSAHPDKNPDMDREEAQARFSSIGDAYEILKSPEKRKEYDTYGRVGTAASRGQGGYASQEEMFNEFMKRYYGQQQEMQERPPPPKPFPQPEMEAWIRADPATVEAASRACGFSTEKDEIRATFAGKLGTVSAVDARDRSVKLLVMVSPGRAAEVWYPVDALWDPRLVKAGFEVTVCADAEAMSRAARAAGISTEKDEIRASCAGKTGTVLLADSTDQTAKVRVTVQPAEDDKPSEVSLCWFPIAALEPA